MLSLKQCLHKIRIYFWNKLPDVSETTLRKVLTLMNLLSDVKTYTDTTIWSLIKQNPDKYLQSKTELDIKGKREVAGVFVDSFFLLKTALNKQFMSSESSPEKLHKQVNFVNAL